MKTFGLIGKNLRNSFSKKYFNQNFIHKGINKIQYLNFELKDISEFKTLIKTNNLSGINVTNPYKKLIIPFLNKLSDEAEEIGAVNTIKFHNGELIGYNTDHIGFTNSIKPLINNRKRAIILGDGGAAKAIKYSLMKLNIEYKTVNRNTSFDYSNITEQIIDYYTIIINTTPVGSNSEKNNSPKIPYEYLDKRHLLFDLIYNPAETKFLAQGKIQNAEIKNGLEMLQIQAKESWNIWGL